jgi:hypothetical protein
MKTAIILFNTPGIQDDPPSHLSQCVDRACKDGYTIIHPTTWREYRRIDFKELLNRYAPDAVYLFIDYGISQLMYDMNLIYYRNFPRDIDIKIELIFPEIVHTLEGILKYVSNLTGVSTEQIKGKSREGNIPKARQFYCYRAKKYTNASQQAIADVIKKHRTTIIHSIKMVSGGCVETEREYKRIFEEKPVVQKEVFKPEPRISKYAGIEPVNGQPYHGYHEHALIAIR